MATHYDTLGVPRSASMEEIRRAYRQLARRLHPDRHLHSPPDEAARAERRMREVNAAWAVLSDGEAKRRYDQALRASTVPPRPSPGAARAASAPPRPAPTTSPLYGHVDVAPGEGVWRAIFRVMPWLVVIVVLGGIFVFTAFAAGSGDSPAAGRDEPTTLPTASVGDCVRYASANVLHLVDCATPNQGRIVEKVPNGRPCPPGSDMRYLPAEGLYACIRV